MKLRNKFGRFRTSKFKQLITTIKNALTITILSLSMFGVILSVTVTYKAINEYDYGKTTYVSAHEEVTTEDLIQQLIDLEIAQIEELDEWVAYRDEMIMHELHDIIRKKIDYSLVNME
jgi:hypothetical protein